MNKLHTAFCLSVATLILACAAALPVKARPLAVAAATLVQDDGSHENAPVPNDEAGEDSREDGEDGHLNATVVTCGPESFGFRPARTFAEPPLHHLEPFLPPPNATSLL